MITKWKLFNFKSVRHETELAMAPLTIFAGANSSGKSTWIQSILLISQTLASRIPSRSVVLNGHLTRLGQFDDLRHFNSDAQQILISWECRPDVSSPADGAEFLETVSATVAFDVDPSSPQRELLQVHPLLFSSELACAPRENEDLEGNMRISIRRANVSGGSLAEKLRRHQLPTEAYEPFRSALDYDAEMDDRTLHWFDEEGGSPIAVGCHLKHFLPEEICFRENMTISEANTVVRALGSAIRLPSNTARRMRVPSRIPNAILERVIPAAVNKLLNDRIGERAEHIGLTVGPFTVAEWRHRVLNANLSNQDQAMLRSAVQELGPQMVAMLTAGQPQRFALRLDLLPGNLRSAADYLELFFGQYFKYLGPLRDEPKPLYPLAANLDPSDVGLQGEHTAAVLNLHREWRITYLPSATFAQPAVTNEPILRTLEAAVVDWLRYMGVIEGIETNDRGKLGHELKVTTAGVKKVHDLTHVGVGVSQVLPIVVSCLLAERDTTLVFEQPELHLHPKVQTLLADFFLSMAMLGKQCIIETHSEYLINRLRFRAAAAPGSTVSSLAKIYFVDKKEGASVFEEVKVNRYGVVENWPEEFFDQTQRETERILMAGAEKMDAEGDAERANRPS